MYVYYNPNPYHQHVDDCVVRGIAKVLDADWDTVYLGIAMQGYRVKNMPSTNSVWGEYLRQKGFSRYAIPNSCPACYTVEDFCSEHSSGVYLLSTGSHVIAVVDGDFYDAWDSGDEVPIYYFERSDKA
jgi:hypothetical protein